MLRCAIAAISAAALSVTLAGCGANPEPKPLPQTESTTPSPSASPTPPALPEAAKGETRAGAISFVGHYIALINHGQATGDTASLSAVESPTCRSCASGRTYLDGIYAGGSISGGAWKFAEPSAVEDPTLPGWDVEAVVTFGPQTIKREGKPDEHLSGGTLLITVNVARKGDGWEVSEWTRAE